MGSLERCVGHVVLVENLVRSVTVAGSSVKIQSVADRIEKSKGKRGKEKRDSSREHRVMGRRSALPGLRSE
jgi:hypothetical protein